MVKHESQTPTGAFTVRGGLVYLDRLVRERPQVAGVVSATRGNHGQSIGVVSAAADATARSFEVGYAVNTDSAATFVDGVATRSPLPQCSLRSSPDALRSMTQLRIRPREDTDLPELVDVLTRQQPGLEHDLGLSLVTTCARHHEVCSGRPSAKPASDCTPTTARSANSSTVAAPA